MRYWTELHGQIFAIAFLGGVVGNLVANAVQSVFLHIHIHRHQKEVRSAVQDRKAE